MAGAVADGALPSLAALDWVLGAARSQVVSIDNIMSIIYTDTAEQWKG